jgi:hypothetical protein
MSIIQTHYKVITLALVSKLQELKIPLQNDTATVQAHFRMMIWALVFKPQKFKIPFNNGVSTIRTHSDSYYIGFCF